jgi:hypothetical protein
MAPPVILFLFIKLFYLGFIFQCDLFNGIPSNFLIRNDEWIVMLNNKGFLLIDRFGL